MNERVCNVPDCNNEPHSRGVCSTHYKQWHRHNRFAGHVEKSRVPGVIARDHELYPTWLEMKDRCTNPNNPYFPWYGGRGATVCEKWRENFWAFEYDVGKQPSEEHVLTRVDPDGDCAPGNVRWVAPGEASQTRYLNSHSTSP